MNLYIRRSWLKAIVPPILFLALSCSSTTFVDDDFFQTPDRKQVIGLVSYRSQYVQTSSGSLLSEEPGGGTLIKDEALLEEKCLTAIEEVLRAKPVLFSYRTGPFNNVPQLENFDIFALENVNMNKDNIERIKEEAKVRNAQLVRTFIAENGLDGALRIENRYVYAGMSLKLTVQTYWTIYNAKGETVLFLISETIDKEGRSFAETLETGLDDEIVTLTGENAKKLHTAIRIGED